MRVFVTGATGFIGGRLTRRLLEAGHTVRALVRDPSRARALTGAELHTGDIRDRGSVRAAMAGAEQVYHVAAWYKIGADDAGQAYDINVVGTRNVLELMREHGVGKGVYTSTIAIYSDTRGHTTDETSPAAGPYNSVYERTKAIAHNEIALPMMAEGLPLVVVQPGVVYGPGDRSPIRDTFVQYLRGKLPAVPKHTTYCWSHVDDIVDAHLLAMDRGRIGEAYIVAGQICELSRAFEIAATITGVPAPKLRLGQDTLRFAAKLAALAGRVVPHLPATFTEEALRSVAGTTSIASSTKAERELGWHARAFEVGLRETMLAELAELGMRAPA
ncbi:MAG: NAD-dependent epimerase/dehydratase family protein [Deltaproteobacteria bacterium]|nr:NAD-dependent epimerase/dehydratase family protein [Nannocystaceae bacterium]